LSTSLQGDLSSYKRLWLIIGIVVAILLIGGIFGSIATMQGPKASTSPTTQPTQPITTQPSQPTPTQSIPTPTVTPHNKVGQMVQVGTDKQGPIWEITLTTAKAGGSESYLKSGNVFLNIQVQVKNISTTEQDISQFDFELRDLEGQRQEVAYDPNAETSPRGTVEAGSPLKGTLTYQIPSSVHQFELFYSMIGVSGQIIWDISV
jgi:Domain of unknown function (DUF4352)